MKTFLTILVCALAPVTAKTESKVRIIHGGFGGGVAVVGSKASKIRFVGGPVPHGGFAVIGSKGSKVRMIGGPVPLGGFAPPIGGPLVHGGPGGPGGPRPVVQQPTAPTTATRRSNVNNNPNNYQKNGGAGPAGFPPANNNLPSHLPNQFPTNENTDNSVYFSNAQTISASLATVFLAMSIMLIL